MSLSEGLLPGASLHPDFSPSSFSHPVYFGATKASPGGSGDGREDNKLPQKVTKDVLKPVVLEWLKSEASQFGPFADVRFFRNFVPPADARYKLSEKDDWFPAIRHAFLHKEHWISSLQEDLTHMPLHYTRRIEYQKELADSFGPKLVRFYRALWNLLVLTIPEEKIRSALSTLKPSKPLSYADRAIYALQYPPIAGFFSIPEDPQEQLALVKELGPQIYKNWSLKA